MRFFNQACVAGLPYVDKNSTTELRYEKHDNFHKTGQAQGIGKSRARESVMKEN